MSITSTQIARVLCLSLASLLLSAGGADATAQDRLFGSLDDPLEVVRMARQDRERHLDAQAGLSLIGAQWRSAARANLRYEGPSSAVQLELVARAGVYGSYGKDFNEPYDFLRLIRYARVDPTARRPLYARLGPLRRMRLGSGHLVDFMSGETAWDDRRVGLETMATAGPFRVSMFAQDVRLGGVVGARSEVRPLSASRHTALSSFRVGISWVSDRATRNVPGIDPVEAWQADIRLEAARSGAFALEPFVSVARYTHYGKGLLFGADLITDNFIDLARLHFRLAVHYGSRRFIPGYFGAFYPVHNELARIVSSARTGVGEDPGLAGISLGNATGGNDVLTELRLYVLDRFELFYAFKRHYGTYPISEYHLRLFVRARRFRFSLGQDRGELKGFFSVFNALGNQSSLYFNASYRVLGRIWVHAEARYTYERVDSGESTAQRYLVQRRFEPFAGLRIPL